jgi:hypothetical protein
MIAAHGVNRQNARGVGRINALGTASLRCRCDRLVGFGCHDRAWRGGFGGAINGRSDPDRALDVLAGGNDFPTVVMAAMAADVMRALQFAAIAALGVRLDHQGLMAPAHAFAGRAGFTLRYGHINSRISCIGGAAMRDRPVMGVVQDHAV